MRNESGAQAPTRGALSAEQFFELQEQLVAVKMQNHDLQEANQRARAGGNPNTDPTASSSSLGVAPASATALGQKLSQQWRVGVTSKKLEPPGTNGAQALLAEVSPLRQQLRTALEELASAKKAAMTAQQQAAAMSAKAEDVNVPSLEELLSKIQDTRRKGILMSRGPEVVARVARAAFAIDAGRRRALVAKDNEAAGIASTGDDQDNLGSLAQIHRQQQDMEKLREAIDKQQAQIGRLTEQAASDKSAKPNTMQALQDRLQAAERHLIETNRRIELSDRISGQMYELKCHLQTLQERAAQREQTMEILLERQGNLTDLQARMTEHLRVAEEDVFARERQLADELAATFTGEAGQVEDDAGSQLEGEEELEEPQTQGEERPPGEDVGLQVDLHESGSPTRRRLPLPDLRASVQAQRSENSTLERESALEVQRLRTLARGSAKQQSELETKPEPTGPSLLVLQKQSELISLRDELENDLELLRSSEQLLRDDTREKAMLIRKLLREVHADSFREERAASTSASSGGFGLAATTLGGTTSALLGLWKKGIGGSRSKKRKATVEELEHVAQEAMLDNLRLRKGLRQIGEEFQKTVAEHPSTSP